ncbi:hypothetical protein [Sphaerothrix gracilis]|uniref:hypothetical protein n=1 Tax=Sphaerothrix gracilis TaxID=3151835 RepID=UPI0031FC5CCC
MTLSQRELQACQGCGAKTTFDPVSGQLRCEYCGRSQALPPANTQLRAAVLVEHSFSQFINANSTQIAALSTTAQEVRCPGCQVTLTFEPPTVADRCPFCASSIVVQPQMANPVLAPAGLIPFQVGRKQARSALQKWLSNRWFAPNSLKKLAQQEQLKGIYLPFWTYDSQTSSRYQGRRGEYYYETETYTETNDEGKTETKTREVRRTRWYPASGTVSRFFDDVLVPAVHSIRSDWLGLLWPRIKAADLEPYDPRYLTGFQAQRYQINLQPGFELAKAQMAGTIRQDVCHDIGGDTQEVISVLTQYHDTTFKHVLLPVWMASYRFQNQQYQVIINGMNGQVVGDRPYSKWKIALAVIAAAIVIAGIIMVAQQNS